MFQFPRYFIFVFVGLSIVTAYCIHRIQLSYFPSHADLSSRAPSALSLDISSVWSAAESAIEISKSNSEDPADCKCLLSSNAPTANFAAEEEVNCPKERQYLKSLVDSMPSMYREARVRSPSEFPKECVIYAMKKWQSGSERQESSSFARCSSKKASIEESKFKPCISRSYVNVVYNYFSDMTDCFGFSQRNFIPQFYRESGFHLNATSSKNTLGVAQLSSVTVLEANKKFVEYQEQVKASTRPSCNRLAASVAKLTPVEKSSNNSCNRLAALESPLLNLFYSAVTEMQNREMIQYYAGRGRRNQFDLYGKMAKLGLNAEMYDQERLVDILSLLSRNTGPASAVILLSNYLDSFASQTKRKLQLSDFSLRGSSDRVQSFYDYARIYQMNGERGYFDLVSEKAKDLNGQFKEGACVPESYLSL